MKESFFQRLRLKKDTFSRFHEDAGLYGVYLFGAGFIGSWSVNFLRDLGIRVHGFIDSNPSKWDSVLSGLKIVSPAEAIALKPQCVLITSRHHVKKVRNSLSTFDALQLSIDEYVLHIQGEEKIRNVGDLFRSDLNSMDTFYAVLFSMLEGETTHLQNYCNSDPFFHRFGFFNCDGETLVDAGAYVGDSVERFIWSVNGVFKHIFAFEPGGKQYNALRTRVERLSVEWGFPLSSITLINKGISNTTKTANLISQGNLIQNRLDSNSETVGEVNAAEKLVEVVSLDDYFTQGSFSLLKVDIEGSELLLLEGAKRCIECFRPRIALSVYHFPTDIFSLPIKCQQMNPDYIFSLGHHSSQLMDTVLYCRDTND